MAIRASHQAEVDRIVFEFEGGLPTRTRVRYVDELIADGSGLPVRIAGRAILRVRFAGAQAHDDQGQTVLKRKSFVLPNIMTTVRAGDFEGVTTYGIGLAKRTAFQVFTLQHPARVVIQSRAAFRTVDRKVFLFNVDNFVDNVEPFFIPVMRPVPAFSPATGVMDRLFAGPVRSEKADGLRLLRSRATGFADLVIEDGVAEVRLTGGCNSNGSTVSIAGEIMPTLRQFATVDWVKILDPSGDTASPTGDTDSIPACLEP
ncbi:AMIN-like domain-containing (lipo)protein [Nocardioides dilutus]